MKSNQAMCKRNWLVDPYDYWVEQNNDPLKGINCHWPYEEKLSRGFKPEVPKSIVAIAEWMKVFSDLKYVYDLKPLLYVYWS